MGVGTVVEAPSCLPLDLCSISNCAHRRLSGIIIAARNIYHAIGIPHNRRQDVVLISYQGSVRGSVVGRGYAPYPVIPSEVRNDRLRVTFLTFLIFVPSTDYRLPPPGYRPQSLTTSPHRPSPIAHRPSSIAHRPPCYRMVYLSRRRYCDFGPCFEAGPKRN